MKTTASLITIHSIPNFGSILQTIATVCILEGYGIKTTVVNYIRNRDKAVVEMFGDADLPFSARLKKFLLSPIALYSLHIHRKYLSDRVDVSRPIYANEDFLSLCPRADIYITGSDQVWNSLHNGGLDRRYYFDGFPEGTIKVAFSSSFGREDLGAVEYEEVKQMLASYKALSVREASGETIIESMGYKVAHLLDPTMVLSCNDWKKFINRKHNKRPYVFVYLPYNVHDVNLIYKTVKQISGILSLDIVEFSHGILSKRRADKTLRLANPGDVLSAIYYADFVITNSFHGTAFSINLNKRFFVYMPTCFSTRISSLLKMCSLENRLLADKEVASEEKIMTSIDYASVNRVIEEERLKTYSFLDAAIR